MKTGLKPATVVTLWNELSIPASPKLLGQGDCLQK